MSGYANRTLSGMRWSLGSKSFVARLEASVNSDLQFKRTKKKTETSEPPYWKSEFKDSITLGGFDSSGNFTNAKGTTTSLGIGDLDWQNKTECLTWFSDGYYSHYRYRRPTFQFTNTYLYHKGKVSKSCPGKIVGAAINKLIGKRYLAVTVQHDPNQETDTCDTLSLWQVRDLEDDDWTLIQEFPPLASAGSLFTSVFFNSTGTEAVAVVERYYSPAAVNRRLRLTVTKNEESTALLASLVLENPYPSSAETYTVIDALSRSTEVVGTSLVACDYWMTGETEELVDLLFQIEGTSSISITASISEDWYYPTSETSEQLISGQLRVFCPSKNVNLISLICSYNSNGYFSTDLTELWSGQYIFSGSSTTTQQGYVILDADLRAPALFVLLKDVVKVQRAISARPPPEGWITGEFETAGTETYQLITYDAITQTQGVSYAYEDNVSTGITYGVLTPFDTDPSTVNPPYTPSTTTYPLNSYESMYTVWGGDWLKGQLKTLIKNKIAYSFLSYLYARDEQYMIPAETFYLYYLTDGDPKVISGITQDIFFTLSVI